MDDRGAPGVDARRPAAAADAERSAGGCAFRCAEPGEEKKELLAAAAAAACCFEAAAPLRMRDAAAKALSRSRRVDSEMGTCV